MTQAQVGPGYVIDMYGRVWIWKPASLWDRVKKLFGLRYWDVLYSPEGASRG